MSQSNDKLKRPFHGESPILRIYKLSPEEKFVVYFYSLEEPRGGTWSGEVTKNIAESRKFILERISKFIRIYNGGYNDSDLELAKNHNNVIAHNLIEEKLPPIEVLKRWIGTDIFSALGLEQLFQKLWDEFSYDSLLIVTDDFEIPWEWSSRQGNEMLCERLNVGKLYPRHITKYVRSVALSKNEYALKNPDEFSNLKSTSKVLLVYDDMNECLKNKSDSLPDVSNEISDIQQFFINAGFSTRKIREINGQKENLEVSLRDELITSNNIKVIHFSGHIDDDGGLIHRAGSLAPTELDGLQFDTQQLKKSKPFIFLNACSSGKMLDIYKESYQLPTMFACIGASACLTTICPIQDKEASYFSKIFYEELLNTSGIQIGEVLKQTRHRFSTEYNSGSPTPFFYSIIGFPQFELFPKFSKELALGHKGPIDDDIPEIPTTIKTK